MSINLKRGYPPNFEKEEPHKAMLTQVSIRENRKEIVNKIDLQWETNGKRKVDEKSACQGGVTRRDR